MRMKFLVGAGLSALLPMAAAADPRDDVVAGMMRCAVIADERQWLDCYYGAAQPVRAELGLSPAPQAMGRGTGAQPRATPQPFVAPAGPRAPVYSGPPPMPRRSGLIEVFGGADVVKNMAVQSYDTKNGAFIITLADGQIWQQTPGDAEMQPAHWTKTPRAVTVSQGAMHTFNLVVSGENVHYKVTRIK